MPYSRLFARVYNTPLLIHPDKARVIEQVFRSHMEGRAQKVALMEDDGPSETPEQRAEREHAARQRAYAGIKLQRADDKPYALTQTGIALIPVLGTLVQRGSWLDSMSGLTSYDMVASLFDNALTDPDVRAVMLEIDSPGGEAYGLIDLADRLYNARGQKPIWAVANEQAYSAAYWLGSAAERLYTPITGGVGSIGAVMLHVDQSKRDSMMGYSYTFIYAGAHKVDGNSHQPINKAALNFAQNEVDRSRGLFAQAVARNRSLAVEAVMGTEAALLTPSDAQEGGFINGIATLFEAVSMLEGELQQGSTGGQAPAGRSSFSNPNGGTMAEKKPADDKAANEAKHTDAQLEAVRTEAKAEGDKAGEARGRAEGVQAERTRLKGIMTHAEAKDRQELALSVATETEMTVEQAGKLLAAAPKQAAGGSLAALMSKVGNPTVGADAAVDGNAAGAQTQIDTRAIYQRFNKQAAA